VTTDTVAAIDCGTNSTRLLIAGTEGESLVRLMRITRLGEDVDASRSLAPRAIERTIAALKEFRQQMDDHGVGRARMVATSAVRDARNGQVFLDAAAETVGLPAELLSGDEEGRLSYRGATADLPPAAGDVVVVDIGGGSTELIVSRRGDLGVISLDLGCVRLTERHFHHDPPSGAELGEAVATIGAELGRAVEAVPMLDDLRPGSRLIGLAGTVSTLSMLEQGMVEYDRERVHHSVLSAQSVAQWCHRLAAQPAVERAERPGMVAGREDVILGGALVLREVMGRLGFDKCVVSESDILDGLVTSVLSRP
jgi:exopolyphosphatase / guanosine-5'-triphosphate,3'-diphosphate pyrophosphatase